MTNTFSSREAWITCLDAHSRSYGHEPVRKLAHAFPCGDQKEAIHLQTRPRSIAGACCCRAILCFVKYFTLIPKILPSAFNLSHSRRAARCAIIVLAS